MARDKDRATRPGGVFWRLVVRSLAKNRVRTAVSLVGIALACALATAVLTTLTSLNHSLYLRASERDGSWYAWSGAASEASVADLAADKSVSAVAVSHELGSALLDPVAREKALYAALAVVEMPSGVKGSEAQVAALTNVPLIAEGRLPETPDEIVLPLRMKGLTLTAEELVGGRRKTGDVGSEATWGVRGRSGAQSDGPLAIGSQLTLDLGTRVYQDDGMATYACDDRYHGGDDGAPSYLRLKDPTRMTYTVVGFRRPQSDELGVNLVSARSAAIAVTCAGAASSYAGVPTSCAVWACADGYATSDAFYAGMDVFYEQDAQPSTRVQVAGCSVHNELLRYKGLYHRDRPLYEGLEVVAAVLLAVIVGAGVSLVHTSFAISVGERTRQLGLLASLGASARQLRHLMVLEALLLGVVGVPTGIALGVGGVAVVLRLTSDDFAYLLDTERGLELFVDVRVVAAIALAAVIVVVLSVWVPALRAGRVSAVEAIRQARDVRIGRSARRELGRMARGGQMPTSASKLPSLAARVAGVPGFVAHRNLARRVARGHAISGALGVSFALMVTVGLISRYLEPVDNAAAAVGADVAADLAVSITPDSDKNATDRRQLVDDLALRLAGVEGVELTSVERSSDLVLRIPAAMVAPVLRQAMAREDEALSANADYYYGDEPAWSYLNGAQFGSDGSFFGDAHAVVVDDATWERLCQSAGVDPQQGAVALAINSYRYGVVDDPDSSVPSAQGVVDAFACAGAVEAFDSASVWEVATKHAGKELNSADQDGVTDMRLGMWDDEPGLYLSHASERDGVRYREERWADLEELGRLGSWQIEVIGLTKQLPDSIALRGYSCSFPLLALPESALDACPDLTCYSTMVGLRCADSRAVRERVDEVLEDAGIGFYHYVDDLQGSVREARALSWTLRLLATLFSVVTLLIALTNAVSTLSHSVGLRAQEFAVLKSIGMGPAAFRAMIVCECASYAARALLVGAVLSAAVDVGLYYGLDLSLSDVDFALPWLAIVAAAASVVALTAATVWYALRKGDDRTIVDALRSDLS